MSNKKIGVIVIHGTMGSVLTKDESTKVWPVIIGSSDHYKKHLLPLPKENEDGIEPTKMLITYSVLTRSLTESFIVSEFLYDWRKNNTEHIGLLKEEIEKLDADEIHIVAHSMGGIIAKLCLSTFKDEECIKKVKKLITIGTPWKGSMDAVKTLLYGSKIPEMKLLTFLTKECSKEISKYFPSVYQLLPNKEFLSILKSENFIPYKLKGKEYDDFDQFYIDILKEDFESNHSYSEVLDNYYQLLNEEIPSSIEMHEIIGTGRPTLKTISENAREEPSALYDEGDSTVPLFSAYSQLEGTRANYYPYFVNKGIHNLMPAYPSVILLIKDIINEIPFTPKSEIFNDLNSAHYKKFNGSIGKIACPVEVSITDSAGNIIYGNIETINEEEIKELLQADYKVNTIGTTTYVIFDNDDETNIENYDSLIIEAYDKGLTSISFDEYKDGKLTNRNAFKTFEIDTKMSATVNLSPDIKESSLVLETQGTKETLHLEEIAVSESTIEPPFTRIELDGEFLLPRGNNLYFAKGELSLKASEIIKKTYEPKQTIVLINGKEQVANEEGVYVLNSNNLTHGKNDIHYFSIDEFDYTENKKEIILYYFEKTTTNVEFFFSDKLYIIHLGEDPKYSSIANTYEFTRAEPTYQFDKQEGVTGRHVVYNNITRNLKVHYTDIFGDEVKYEYVIDEKLAKKIIHGSATVSEVEKFVELLNLGDVSYQFHPKKQGNFTTLNDSNLNLSLEKFEISSEHTLIEIKKNVEQTVSFESMAEHIKISKDTKYNFVFKVIDFSKTYVPDLFLKALFYVTIKEKPLLIEEIEINYNEELYSYAFSLNFNKSHEIFDSYWEGSSNILSNGTLEVIDNNRKTTLRTIDLQIVN
ncbi:hypothetical protein CBR59_28210 [Bacillus thuringiensis]|uniref:lipase/acyltransferase domain-containing protein n=1 Tax=Bacillus thuringiensis TaxID=1428 RepID=UPI000CBA39B4|nr:acyltransferase [Bacillus thuringiensis]MDA2275492.1 acyltransferase [Bacillus cereus]PNK23401.1 hypothetical protein CBP87_28675 [Bacillus thuringiensis]PNK48244.1 hypothetical protein CBR59_28210 [Bacillus thuringiensis]